MENLKKSVRGSRKTREMKKMKQLLILGKTKDCTRKEVGRNLPFGSVYKC